MNRIQDSSAREICSYLLKGWSLEEVRRQLNMPLMAFEMFVDEIKRVLFENGLELKTDDYSFVGL
jgi:hypothetical protein